MRSETTLDTGPPMIAPEDLVDDKRTSSHHIHSYDRILYQRGLYPPEDFKMVKKYNLNMLVSTDDGLQGYLKKIMGQLNGRSTGGARDCCGGLDQSIGRTSQRGVVYVNIPLTLSCRPPSPPPPPLHISTLLPYHCLKPAWLLAGKVSRLVLAIISKETREVVERWQFDVALEEPSTTSEGADEDAKENQPTE